ncbi:MAG TPA: glycosyltransferase family 4 protein [Thermoanaerobaculaceae bacterium]|nr:glycosyltransferase family 4 protein [Thermoanaerobaculaceae bacterium]
MRILQLVSGDRWTGAAATALQLAEALRGAGVDCHLAYRPGRNLENRLRGLAWCHPALAKERTLGDLRAAMRRVRELASGFDVVVAHLSHDHALAKLALPGPHPRLFRNVHHIKHLRADPFHRWLFRGVAGAGLANSAMLPRCRRFPALRSAPVRVLPVALESRFAPSGAGPSTRRRLGIPDGAFLAGTIGKLDRGRGHDVFIHALAATAGAWGMIIGKGPHVPALQKLAARLGVAERLCWPGYVEEGLEALYAAMDVFVFPAAGSDHAHRAIAEAAGCGVPSVAADLPGVADLVVPGETGELYPADDAAALAVRLGRWLADRAGCRRAGAAAAARARERWTPERLAAAGMALFGCVAATRG